MFHLLTLVNYPVFKNYSKPLRPRASPRTVIVGAVAIAGLLLTYLKYGPTLEWGALTFYFAILLAIAVVDIKHNLIPNRIVYPACPIALLLASFYPIGLAADRALPESFLYALLGGAAAFIMLFIPALVWAGRMGWGDVKFAGLLGIITGFPGCFVALALAILGAGGLSIVLLLLRRRQRQDNIPFGPFLSAGALATLVFGKTIVSWYLGLI